MMRKSFTRLARRAAASSFMAVVITASGMASPALTASQAAAGQSQLTKFTDKIASRGKHRDAENSAEAKLPSPPRPPQTRPTERVVAGGGTVVPNKATVTPVAYTVNATPAAVVAPKSGTAAPGGSTARTLVLYDNTGPYAWLGEVYAIQAANLVSHFTAWTVHPVGQYTKNEIASYAAVIYVGSTYDEPIPVAFLDDVNATTKPVIWMYDNIWQLTARDATFATKRGFTWKAFDLTAVARVDYKGTQLTRDTINQGGIMDHVVSDATKAKTVATAVRPDGTSFPWAIRSANFTYIGEIPFAYVTHDDRYLAYADMLYDALAPTAATRHRALVRIEDVGPDAEPAELRAVTDYLYSKKILFTVAVYPRYRDPRGALTNGRAEDYTLTQRPLVVAELKYMQSHGGTLLMHGYTHQYNAVINPYDGVSANDFEFYRAHVDASDRVIYDGPVTEDTTAYINGRVTSAKALFTANGLTQPTIFEFPHYAGSVVDYRAIQTTFGKAYDRRLYFPGLISGAAIDYTKMSGQFFPYSVRDVYGTVVVPENIGNIEPVPFNTHPARLPADLIASAKRNLVIRDGMASFFYHPYLGTTHLKSTVEGLQAAGYTFVTAASTIS